MTEEHTPPARKTGLLPEGSTRTGIYLLIASLLVGFVLATLGINPVDFWRGMVTGIANLFQGLLDMGWSAVYRVVQYVLLGAVIVVPIWLLMHFANRSKR